MFLHSKLHFYNKLCDFLCRQAANCSRSHHKNPHGSHVLHFPYSPNGLKPAQIAQSRAKLQLSTAFALWLSSFFIPSRFIGSFQLGADLRNKFGWIHCASHNFHRSSRARETRRLGIGKLNRREIRRHSSSFSLCLARTQSIICHISPRFLSLAQLSAVNLN